LGRDRKDTYKRTNDKELEHVLKRTREELRAKYTTVLVLSMSVRYQAVVANDGHRTSY
jgi:hypothetical protein